ncbi:MAG: protoporphyrinogen oxidase [Candidatus Tectomicrobia bacterium]|uniref:Coproporphyrinogen III oxidase n=1 Tax=Tectimicrobiota bacterium TaxID=2528274 RepID=A0A932M144_UNCTE|nr:protoporphyrinogen oxidase [Candidatus Tectomicrobia bacterium]
MVGGGVAGLAAANRLVEERARGELPLEIILLEAEPRLGGVIRTVRRDGFLIESGPDSFITEKPWAIDLCRRLGLEGELIGTNEACRRSFIIRGGRLMPVPEAFYLLAPARLGPFLSTPIFSWPGKFRMMLDLFLPRRKVDADESLASFVRRRLGKEALERMAQPMVAGIYTADPERLSLRATFPRFHEMERVHGSMIRALRARVRNPSARGQEASGPRYGLFATLRSGMQTIPDTLSARLTDVTIRTGVRVSELRPGGTGSRWLVRTTAGGEIPADALCLAIPADRAGALLNGTDPILAQALGRIPYASTITLHAAYRREDVPHPLTGFGFVVPAVENRDILACTFASVKFPGRAPDGTVLLRAFLGGATRPDLAQRDDAELEAAVHRELCVLLGIEAEPLFVEIHRHPQSMAQYLVGHPDRVREITARVLAHPGLALAGNGYEGIGVPDCIHSGERAAEELLRDFPQVLPLQEHS